MCYFRKLLFNLCVLIIVFAIPSCSLKLSKNEPEDNLKVRINEYWEAMIKGHYRVAYQYLDPRNRVSSDRFVEGASNFKFLDYKIEDVKVKGDRGIAKINFTIKIKSLQLNIPEIKRTEEEEWNFLDGQWYYTGSKQ